MKKAPTGQGFANSGIEKVLIRRGGGYAVVMETKSAVAGGTAVLLALGITGGLIATANAQNAPEPIMTVITSAPATTPAPTPTPEPVVTTATPEPVASAPVVEPAPVAEVPADPAPAPVYVAPAPYPTAVVAPATPPQTYQAPAPAGPGMPNPIPPALKPGQVIDASK